MPLQIVVGTQWGDEGKGRVVDLLAARADIAARYNGGDNAGHTVTVGDETFKLHLIPSGVIHAHTVGVMGGGMVINPATLFSEIETLTSAGVEINPRRLRISYAAHLITPAHRAMDAALEQSRGGGKIGTTGRGIGPAYTDKAARRGLRLEDMLLPAQLFAEKMTAHTKEANRTLRSLYGVGELDVAQVRDEYMDFAARLQPYIADTGLFLQAELNAGRKVLAEGAQGTLLDIDLGTYPYVTSSSTSANGVLAGLGLGVQPVENVTGVTKSFQTRVGEGPFPTEVSGDLAMRLRGTGANPWDEYGTTTGRPRRVGWLDMVLLRYAARVNGLTELVVTKLDVLSGLPELKICSAYRNGAEPLDDLPFGPSNLEPYEPVYETLPGWQADVSGVRQWADLPAEAQAYLRRIEELCGVPVKYVSVGAERSQIVER
jgi:adenylosuccinate synthase